MANINEKSAETQAVSHDLAAELKRQVEETRLPPAIRDEILADMPTPAEHERLMRELQSSGGLSSKEFLDSLAIQAERKL